MPRASSGGWHPRLEPLKKITVTFAMNVFHAGRCLRQAAAVGCLLAAAGPLTAGELGPLLKKLTAPFEAAHREKPPIETDPCVDELAARLEWIEHRIDTHGSIVAKQPDVWGQSRLTRHRYEYEEQLRRQLDRFEERAHAAIRRSDQQYLGMALALQAAAGRRRRGDDVVAVPEASVVNQIGDLLPSGNEGLGRDGQLVISRSAPFTQPGLPGAFPEEPIGLEPTLHLDHLSRYLHHLHALRRVNEGDDSADAPGYALNLIRVPVSILPGSLTRRGYGGEITLTVTPQIDADLLPRTFRNLVINDLVDTIAPALTHCVNDADCLRWARTIDQQRVSSSRHSAVPQQSFMAAIESLGQRLPAIAPSPPPVTKSRRARLPLPGSQLADVAGVATMARLIVTTHTALASHPVSQPCIEFTDVRAFLTSELEAACDFLAVPAQREIWQELAGWRLAELIRGRQIAAVDAIRCHAFRQFGATDLADPAAERVAGPDDCCPAEPTARSPCKTTTAALAWAILVESALLDARLADDIAATTLGGSGMPCLAGPFFGPSPSPEARATFADYVRRRWPVRVFALDPVIDEQNVEESFARRREAQIAMAVAFASGRTSAQALTRATRRLELDMATVALNRTAVGFTHGADTFGWRFAPRVQPPPTRTGLAGWAETLCGTSSDADLASRCLEPGIRECMAVIVMPSFIPGLSFDVHTNWFALAHPKDTEPDLHDTVKLARAVAAVRESAVACQACRHRYADGLLAQLLRRADQLEQELSLQTLAAKVPLENTAGGFELFDAGITDLAPELTGWYGAPGIDRQAATTLFLVGEGFSIHDTRLLAGGRAVPFRLLSREVMEVTIPPSVQPLAPVVSPPRSTAGLGQSRSPLQLVTHADAEPLPAPPDSPPAGLRDPPAVAPPVTTVCRGRELVDFHLATPYGVSSHLLVPVVSRHRPGTLGGLAIVGSPTVGLTFTAKAPRGSDVETAKVDAFFSISTAALEIAVPESFFPPAKPVLSLTLRQSGSDTIAATLGSDDLAYDAARRRYVIAGENLTNLIGDSSRPATDSTLRGAVRTAVDRLLLAGGLRQVGDRVSFTATGSLTADQQIVPIGGSLTITATRRGNTLPEPEASPADTLP